MTIKETANTIRVMLTALIIAEYQLIRLKDGTKNDLKMRVGNAISSCRKVQEYFITHNSTTPENKEIFKQQFLSNEIVLLSELLETCFSLDEESLENIISSIKQALEPVEAKN